MSPPSSALRTQWVTYNPDICDDVFLFTFDIIVYWLDFASFPFCRTPSVSHAPVPNSYTNPAYFIFEGMPVLRRVEETPAPSKKSQVVWDKNTVIQLPRVTGGQSHGKWSARRSDFTEIEIPGSLPPYKPSCDSELPSSVSSYQLFPGPDVSPNTQQRHSASNPSLPLPSYMNNMGSVLSVKKGPNSYMNHSVFSHDVPLKEKVRIDHRLNQGRPMRNGPKPYKSTRVPVQNAFVPWKVEQPTAAAGDNSLTALQIAKSLSEVDFQPVDRQYQYHQMSPRQRYQAYDYSLASEKGYGWEKEVSWVI